MKRGMRANPSQPGKGQVTGGQVTGGQVTGVEAQPQPVYSAML